MAYEFIVKNGLIVNTSLIYAVSSSGKVGIANTAPDATLTVTGTANVQGAFKTTSTANVGSTLGVVGVTTLSNTLSVAGLATFSASANVVGSLNVTVNTTISGNTTVSNRLTVTGASSFANTLLITGAANVMSTLGVSGQTNLFNTSVGGTLGVTGAATFSNTSAHTGAATFSNTVTITGTTNVSTLNSSGAVNFGAAANVAGAMGVAGLLTTLNQTATGNVRAASLGVGTAASGTAGEIRATNNITAYYSDKRLKEEIETITNALEKVKSISGVTYRSNALAGRFGYTDKSRQIGVLAQEIRAVVPEAVKLAPFDTYFTHDGQEHSRSGENYLTVQYDRLIPLLIEAIKELAAEVDELKGV
jgi:hypothetical protein